MAQIIRGKIEGAKELEQALRAMSRQTLRAATLRAGMRKALEPVAQTASQLAPRRTGRGAASIAVRSVSRRQGGQRGDITMGVSYDADHFYLGFHETGYTSRGGTPVPARPFLRPAWDQESGEIPATFGKEAWASIERRARREARRGGAR